MATELASLFRADHYLALMLTVILCCLVFGRKKLSGEVSQGSFWVTILVCVLLVAQDILENYTLADPSRRTLRLAVSIAGYALRPVAVLGFLLVVWPPWKKHWYLWIPAVLNALLYSTAWFSPLAFSFDADFRFTRGPLGWMAFPVCIICLVLVLITVRVRFRDSRAGDSLVLYVCALGCLGAMLVDIRFESVSLVCAILISSMAFFHFLQTQETDHDPLTRLLNRMVFYEDCKRQKTAITAVASIDMNGLKRTNDELGHEAGDRALRMIGRGLRAISSRRIMAYRVGGDEFTVLFHHCSGEEVEQALTAFRNEMWRVAIPVAVGCAVRTDGNETPEELFRLSDKRMYEDKRQYYQTHDRRRAR